MQAAAKAELQRVARRHDQLLARAATLEAEFSAVESAARDLQRQLVELASLADVDPRVEDLRPRSARSIATPDLQGDHVVRGRRIRVEAVRSMLAFADGDQAHHYSEWFRRFSEAGFRVDAVDPQAAFLTQLGRSPVVRRSSKAGIYQLDDGAVARLRRRVDTAEAALREAPSGAADPQAAMRNASELAAAQRRLDEALESLGDSAAAGQGRR